MVSQPVLNERKIQNVYDYIDIIYAYYLNELLFNRAMAHYDKCIKPIRIYKQKDVKKVSFGCPVFRFDVII